jgi:hypothetical protein
MSTVCPGATLLGRLTDVGPPILLPESNTREYDVVHVHVPMFFSRHVFVNAAFGANVVPSGTVTSATNCAQSQVVAAETGWVFDAAGTNERASARSITAQLSRNVGFMAFSS